MQQALARRHLVPIPRGGGLEQGLRLRAVPDGPLARLSEEGQERLAKERGVRRSRGGEGGPPRVASLVQRLPVRRELWDLQGRAGAREHRESGFVAYCNGILHKPMKISHSE
jgi:hypothetical protein